MNTLPIPPLIGDGQGRYRVKITGNSGAGKTTLAKALAGILDVPYISFDGLIWKPGWEATPVDEFRERLRVALDQDPRGWVIDGDFTKRLGHDDSTDIIWLDPPLLLYFPRLLLRTFLRLLGVRAPCSPGCQDTVREAFTRDGILWLCLSKHWAQRRKRWGHMKDFQVAVDSAGKVTGKMRRIGGWGDELKQWWNQVEDMVRARATTALAIFRGVYYGNAMNHPFQKCLVPIYPLGKEPLPPGLTEEDRQQYLETKKWEGYMAMGMESCMTKTILAGGAGFGIGAFFSLMSASFAYEDPYLRQQTQAVLNTGQKAKEIFKDMGKGMYRSGKGFGKVGALFAGIECVIESYRAKNDIVNSVASGFVAGGVLARNSGPRAAVGGGLAFAAFSAVIDLVFLRREPSDDD